MCACVCERVCICVPLFNRIPQPLMRPARHSPRYTLCVYVCVCMCVCVCVYIMYVCVCVSVCEHVCICVPLFNRIPQPLMRPARHSPQYTLCVCMCVCVHVRVGVCLYYVCVCVKVCVCVFPSSPHTTAVDEASSPFATVHSIFVYVCVFMCVCMCVFTTHVPFCQTYTP